MRDIDPDDPGQQDVIRDATRFGGSFDDEDIFSMLVALRDYLNEQPCTCAGPRGPWCDVHGFTEVGAR